MAVVIIVIHQNITAMIVKKIFPDSKHDPDDNALI